MTQILKLAIKFFKPNLINILKTHYSHIERHRKIGENWWTDEKSQRKMKTPKKQPKGIFYKEKIRLSYKRSLDGVDRAEGNNL